MNTSQQTKPEGRASRYQWIKPRVYKKTLYIGNKRLFKFTSDYTRKFLFRLFWIILIITMITTMVLGGVGMVMGTDDTTTPETIQLY